MTEKAKNATDNDIFDWIIKKEDNCLKGVREEVINLASSVYGERGLKIAEKYYRQIDGEEDFENDDKEVCPECEKNAKQVVENMDLIKDFTEIMLKDSLKFAIDEIEDFEITYERIKEDFDIIYQDTIKDGCLEISKDELMIRFFLEICRRIRNDSRTRSESK